MASEGGSIPATVSVTAISAPTAVVSEGEDAVRCSCYTFGCQFILSIYRIAPTLRSTIPLVILDGLRSHRSAALLLQWPQLLLQLLSHCSGASAAI